MKKFLAIFFACLLIFSLVGCDRGKGETANYRLGIGTVPYIENNTKDSAQFNATIAAVVIDSRGKIVDCKIDAIQNTVGIKGGVIDDKAYSQEFKTKQQLGNDYGMKEASGIGKEWYEQADFFSDYVIGMTEQQVADIAMGDDNKAEDAVILAGCTIGINDFIKAVTEGCKQENSKSFSGSNFKLGISAVSNYKATSANASANNKGIVKLESDICAVVTDNEKKVMATLIDVIEPEIEFDAGGNVLTPSESVIFTKREMKDDYGMRKASKISREWYEQAAAFEDYVVGLDGVGVNSMKTVVNTETGKILTDEAELRAGCTIAVDGFMRVCHSAIESIK